MHGALCKVGRGQEASRVSEPRQPAQHTPRMRSGSSLKSPYIETSPTSRFWTTKAWSNAANSAVEGWGTGCTVKRKGKRGQGSDSSW